MKDKIKHAFMGALIAAAIGVPCYISSLDLFAGLWGCLSGVIAGGIKEWCDNTYGGKIDWKDFGTTCIGVVISMIFILCLAFGKG